MPFQQHCHNAQPFEPHPFSPIALAPSLVRDLNLLARMQAIDAVSERRRNVVLAWQKRARGARRQRFRIEASSLTSTLRVDASTDYRSDDADQWVKVEAEVHGSGRVIHRINGVEVLTYEGIQLDPNDPDGKRLMKGDQLLISSGYISLQSESHPCEFRNVELMELPN